MYVMYQSVFARQPFGKGFILNQLLVVRASCYMLLPSDPKTLVRNRVQLGNSSRFASRYDKEAFLKGHVFRYMVSLTDPDKQAELFRPYFKHWLRPETVQTRSGVLLGYHRPIAYQYAFDLIVSTDVEERPVYLWMARVGLPAATPSWTFGTLARKDPAVREPMLPDATLLDEHQLLPKLEDYYRKLLQQLPRIYDTETYREHAAQLTAEERFFVGLAYVMNQQRLRGFVPLAPFLLKSPRHSSLSEGRLFRLTADVTSEFTPNVGLEASLEPQQFAFAAFGTGLLTRLCRMNFELMDDPFGMRLLRAHQLLYQFFRQEPDQALVYKTLVEWLRHFGRSNDADANDNSTKSVN